MKNRLPAEELTEEERAIWKAYLSIPEVREYYLNQCNSPNKGELPGWYLGWMLGISTLGIYEILGRSYRKIRQTLVRGRRNHTKERD